MKSTNVRKKSHQIDRIYPGAGLLFHKSSLMIGGIFSASANSGKLGYSSAYWENTYMSFI